MRAKIPSFFELLMEPHIRHLDEIISPGLSSLTWSSLKISQFVSAVYDGLAELELLIDRANQLTGTSSPANQVTCTNNLTNQLTGTSSPVNLVTGISSLANQLTVHPHWPISSQVRPHQPISSQVCIDRPLSSHVRTDQPISSQNILTDQSARRRIL